MPRGYRSGIVTGIALSLGAALLSPVLARWGRPALKTAAKGGLVAYAAARERVAEMTEAISDVLAEAQFELATEQATEGAPAQRDRSA
jgi:hypothetical protein